MENKTVTIDDTFIVHKTLGQGFTSQVVLAEHKETKYNLAIKIFKPIKSMKLVVTNFRKEVDSMKDLKHENLINIIAANESGILLDGKNKQNIIYIGVELAENAELFDFIADPGRSFNESMCRSLFAQLISGLKAMHDKSVAHRDLKTENLFLDGKFNLKIGDFGFAKYMDPNSNEGKLRTQLGTSGYQCPELIEGKPYSGEANDIFACGVILFILANAYPPFREAKRTDGWYRNIYHGKYAEFWAQHSKAKISPELKDLITGMLKYQNRFSLNDIINHPWLKGNLPSKEEYTEDMLIRKKSVDARREKESLEKLQVVSSGSNSGTYRGESEEVKIQEFYALLEKNSPDTFPHKKLEDSLPKNFFRFNDNDILKVYKYLISLLVNEQAEIEMDNENFSLTANVPFANKLDEESNDEEDSISHISFISNLYLSPDSEFVIVEVIKDNITDPFALKKFMNYMNDKIVNDQ